MQFILVRVGLNEEVQLSQDLEVREFDLQIARRIFKAQGTAREKTLNPVYKEQQRYHKIQ